MPAPRLIAVLLSVLTLVALAACGDDESEEGDSPDVASPSAIAATSILPQPDPVQALDEGFSEASDGVIQVTIRGAVFRGNKLKVPFGQSAKIDVTNKDEQRHNLRIAGFDGEFQTEDDAVSSPDPIEGAGSGSLEFAPLVPGAYTFRCDYHPGSMGGQIVVE